MSDGKLKPRRGGQVLIGVWMPVHLVAELDAHINQQLSETDRSKFVRSTLREKLGITKRGGRR